MALSRWNHSRWYIYEQDGGLVVMGDGFISLDELNADFDKTMIKFRYTSSENNQLCEDYSSDLDFLELKMYVKAWQNLQNSESREDIDKANQKIESLRKYGHRRFYLMFGNFKDFISHWDKDVSPNEKFVKIKNQKLTFLYYDDLIFSKVKILKFEKNLKYENLGLAMWDVEFEYKNSKNITKKESERCFLNNLLEMENPLIVGETYLYHKESGTFYNEEKKGFAELKNKHIDSLINMLEKSKVKLLV